MCSPLLYYHVRENFRVCTSWYDRSILLGKEAKATAKYMDEKVAHYEAILAGLVPDNTNQKKWTSENRPKYEKL